MSKKRWQPFTFIHAHDVKQSEIDAVMPPSQEECLVATEFLNKFNIQPCELIPFYTHKGIFLDKLIYLIYTDLDLPETGVVLQRQK